jgi:hypothetical protein
MVPYKRRFQACLGDRVQPCRPLIIERQEALKLGLPKLGLPKLGLPSSCSVVQ